MQHIKMQFLDQSSGVVVWPRLPNFGLIQSTHPNQHAVSLLSCALEDCGKFAFIGVFLQRRCDDCNRSVIFLTTHIEKNQVKSLFSITWNSGTKCISDLLPIGEHMLNKRVWILMFVSFCVLGPKVLEDSFCHFNNFSEGPEMHTATHTCVLSSKGMPIIHPS